MENLYYILLFVQFITVFAIFFSSNPMYSVLCMILLFFESALVVALFTLEFFALAFIIVYVGAVAILFLFVVMLLETKAEKQNILLSFCLTLFIGIIFFFKSYNFFIIFFCDISHYLTFNVDIAEEIFILGQALYTVFLPCVLIVGFILLFAMLGAIFLTFDFNIIKKRKFSAAARRLSRSTNFLAFFQ